MKNAKEICIAYCACLGSIAPIIRWLHSVQPCRRTPLQGGFIRNHVSLHADQPAGSPQQRRPTANILHGERDEFEISFIEHYFFKSADMALKILQKITALPRGLL